MELPSLISSLICPYSQDVLIDHFRTVTYPLLLHTDKLFHNVQFPLPLPQLKLFTLRAANITVLKEKLLFPLHVAREITISGHKM